MTSEIKTWQIIKEKLVPLESSLVHDGKKEKDDIRRWSGWIAIWSSTKVFTSGRGVAKIENLLQEEQ